MSPPGEHPAARYRSDQGAVFSSSKCPPGPGQTCGLPFGFVWTPLAPLDASNHPTPSNNQIGPPDGAICITCLAYINLYCKVDLDTGRWTCALCNAENIVDVAPAGDLGNRSINVLDAHSDWLSRYDIVFRQALKFELAADLASASPSSPMWTTQRIVLVVDQNLPPTEALAVGAVMQRYSVAAAADHYEIEWGLIVFGGTVQIYHVGSDVASGMAAADVIYRSSNHSQNRATLPSDVDQRDMGGDDTDENHVVYLGRSIDTLLTCLSAPFGMVRPSSDSGNPLHSNGLDPLDTTDEPVKKSRLQILKERKQARMEQEGNSSSTPDHKHASAASLSPPSPWVVARERSAATASPLRCTGKAIQWAMDLMSVVTPDTAASPSANRRHDRILLFTNGCPNHGDGSVVDLSESGHLGAGAAAYSTVDAGKLARASEFYDVIAKAAAEAGIGIDVFCTGASELGLPAYQSLVEPSSGYVLLHDTFTTPHLQLNVQYVLLQTRLVLAQYISDRREDEGDPLVDHQNDSSQFIAPQNGSWIDSCTVDIRMSRYAESPIPRTALG
jgi:Sec23/Sec24 trunk domain/Sec23/Sec24 zinc finger